MIDHQIRLTFSFNDADLKRFAEITCLNPLEVLGLRLP